MASGDSGATFRQNLFGLSNVNNAINPFAALFARLPSTLIRNPDSGASLTNNYESCVDASGLSGICVRPLVCAGFGGRLASSCGLGTVCCVSKYRHPNHPIDQSLDPRWSRSLLIPIPIAAHPDRCSSRHSL